MRNAVYEHSLKIDIHDDWEHTHPFLEIKIHLLLF
jgi:hypothetical protein